jgi:glycoprotein-N-acetylgalactosamine 3-beta-galactosyltransferase
LYANYQGAEEYNNIWQKVRSMWSYIYDNYYNDYDWFHIGGDDLYLIVENLRLYVESDEIKLAANGGEFFPYGNETKQLPLFLGRRFMEQGNDKRIFNSGGSGYTMNKAALKGLVAYAFPKCMPHLHTFAEDVMVAQCFRNHLNVFPYDTKDENGGERYMPFAVSIHYQYLKLDSKPKQRINHTHNFFSFPACTPLKL